MYLQNISSISGFFSSIAVTMSLLGSVLVGIVLNPNSSKDLENKVAPLIASSTILGDIKSPCNICLVIPKVNQQSLPIPGAVNKDAADSINSFLPTTYPPE